MALVLRPLQDSYLVRGPNPIQFRLADIPIHLSVIQCFDEILDDLGVRRGKAAHHVGDAPMALADAAIAGHGYSSLAKLAISEQTSSMIPRIRRTIHPSLMPPFHIPAM